MEVSPAVPVKTVPEFIAYAKANPPKINMASAGIGTGNHLFGALFGMMTGIDMIHVPYRGDMFPDLIGGQVQVYFGAMGASIELIRAGKMRALAVTTATRWEGTPDIPTVNEFVPGYEASVWFGVGAPKTTPVAIIDKLNTEINAALADPKIKARLAGLGIVIPGSPADFGKLIADETTSPAVRSPPSGGFRSGSCATSVDEFSIVLRIGWCAAHKHLLFDKAK
jgi:tripartite-type tricarboxylate transporter receptor subunit TctC